MSTTISIRIDAALKDALEEQARLKGVNLSRYVRELLEKGAAPASLRERAGHLKGRLHLRSASTDPWVAKLRERNWR